MNRRQLAAMWMKRAGTYSYKQGSSVERLLADERKAYPLKWISVGNDEYVTLGDDVSYRTKRYRAPRFIGLSVVVEPTPIIYRYGRRKDAGKIGGSARFF